MSVKLSDSFLLSVLNCHRTSYPQVWIATELFILKVEYQIAFILTVGLSYNHFLSVGLLFNWLFSVLDCHKASYSHCWIATELVVLSVGLPQCFDCH